MSSHPGARQALHKVNPASRDPRRLAAKSEALAADYARRTALRVEPGAGLGDILSPTKAKAALDAVTVENDALDWAASELQGTGAIATRLNIAPATLANWRQARRVVAFRKGPRNFVYPIRQFGRFGPVEGLGPILARFASSEDAWEWLVTPNVHTRWNAPLDHLKDGHVAEVTRAAAGALDFG